jgi:hypothetical protein
VIWSGRRKPPKAKFFCTHCGRNEIDARELGCGEPKPRYHPVPRQDALGIYTAWERITACPMEIRSRFRRFLFNRFGVMP